MFSYFYLLKQPQITDRPHATCNFRQNQQDEHLVVLQYTKVGNEGGAVLFISSSLFIESQKRFNTDFHLLFQFIIYTRYQYNLIINIYYFDLLLLFIIRMG